MIKIYHNPRCRKSREGLAVLEAANVTFEIVKYLDNPYTESDLELILAKLRMKPIALVRTKETIWKDNYKGKELTDKQVLQAMVKFPKLVERPIVINGEKVALGRPAENISAIL